MMASPKSTPTPKRKRDMETDIVPIQFSFNSSQASTSAEDGSRSPRSHVAHKFRGLLLGTADSGGGVPAGGTGSDMDDAISKSYKRQKTDEMMVDELKEPSDEVVVDPTTPVSVEKPTDEELQATRVAMPVAEPNISPSRSGSSSKQQTNSNSRKKKRNGTPPPRRRKVDRSPDDEESEAEIVDPVRAALTWREDEITVYDPEDEDDDGTGINGVGFKPTPAIAYARVMKRRQQIADYRKREESDARARRSQRRNAPLKMASLANKHHSPQRKVQFLEGEKLTFITTTS